MILLLLGCVAHLCGRTPAGDARILAVGDSVLAWNHRYCQSIPDWAAMAAGRPVRNEAENGAGLVGDVPYQYRSGDWDWVIVDGGANDVNWACPGPACAERMDRLVSKDGSTGVMAELVDRARADGARVILLRYYEVPGGAWYGFPGVHDEILEIGERYARLAASRDGVVLLDLRTLMSPDHPRAYAFDRVHPDPRSARRIGAVIARIVAADAVPR